MSSTFCGAREVGEQAQVVRRCGSSPCGGDCAHRELGSVANAAIVSDRSLLPKAPPLVHEVLSSQGQPLELPVRRELESKFGHDFSLVRVHTDETAAASARAVRSIAYTAGRHIVFDTGRYAPKAPSGRALIAHELTHVIQQTASPEPAGGRLELGDRAAPEEREAEAVARGAATDAKARVVPAASASAGRAILRRRDMGGETNWAFDTGNLTESHLQDPEIAARLNAMNRGELIRYRRLIRDPVVQQYIDNLLAQLAPSPPCSPAEIARLNRQVEAARTATHPWIGLARRALDRLHSAWITDKADLLNGSRRLEGVPVCAFNSNFNITQLDPNYGVRHIRVMSRLRQLERVMSRTSIYSCQPDDDPNCMGTDQDTIAYVRNNRAPIHFCRDFRDEPDTMSQQATVTHEFAHFLPGVHDQGGYALGGFGAQVMTCATNFKFTAASDVLDNSADPLAGFVMHVGQQGDIDVRVR